MESFNNMINIIDEQKEKLQIQNINYQWTQSWTFFLERFRRRSSAGTRAASGRRRQHIGASLRCRRARLRTQSRTPSRRRHRGGGVVIGGPVGRTRFGLGGGRSRCSLLPRSALPLSPSSLRVVRVADAFVSPVTCPRCILHGSIRVGPGGPGRIVVSPSRSLRSVRLPFLVSRGRDRASPRPHGVLRPHSIHAHSSDRGVCGAGTTIKCWHARRFGSPSAGSGPRLDCISASPPW